MTKTLAAVKTSKRVYTAMWGVSLWWDGVPYALPNAKGAARFFSAHGRLSSCRCGPYTGRRDMQRGDMDFGHLGFEG